MKVFLHIGDTKGFLTDWLNESGEKIKGNEIRAKALAQIDNAVNGSWILRESSITSSDFIKAFAITYKNNSGTINHCPIAHVYGFGYIELNVNREAKMPFEQSKAMFPAYKSIIQPSFIDLIENLATRYNFNISSVIKNI